MPNLTPSDLRHLKAIVTAERQVYAEARAALESWLPLVVDAVLDDAAVVAAIDPDRASRAQAAWDKSVETVLATLGALWAKRYKRKGKNKRKMDSELAKFRARTAELLSGVTKKVYADVQELVVELRASGASDEAIREAVREQLTVENYDSTAERISRTSVMSAYNDGAEQGFRDFAVATGQPVTKTWRAILDGRVRESHAIANGQTVGLDEHFAVGGYFCQHPGDDSLPAWEAVNCRCVAEFKLNGIVAGIGAAGITFTVERAAGRCQYAEWVVVRDDTQAIVGEHSSKAMAFVQLRALQQAAAEDVNEGVDTESEVESIEIDDASPVVAAVSELATGWRGPIAALDRQTGDPRWLATPPDGLRTREYPMSMTRKHVSDDTDIFIGNIHAAWIQDGMVWAEGSFDLGGEEGREASRLVSNRLLFTTSIEPDQITGEQWLIDADGNKAADDVMEEAINTGLVPEGYSVITAFVDWRLASVALVSIPAYDEARIEPVFDYVAPDYTEPDHSDSAMIALRPMTPEYFAVEGGLAAEDIHVTLRYLGDAETIGSGMIPGLHGAALAAAGALKRKKKRARVAGYGQLGDQGAVVLFLNGPEIADAHYCVETQLAGDEYATLPEPHAPYLAHLTLGYGIDPELAKKYIGYEFDFAGVSFDYGKLRTDYAAPAAQPVVASNKGYLAVSDELFDAARRAGLISVNSVLEDGRIRYDLAPGEIRRTEALVAAMGGQIFRAASFERVAAGPTPLTVDEDGSIYGHVRLYGTCYQYGGGQGDGGYCVEPPLSECAYEKFHVHGAKLDDGRIISVGAITYGEGHESRGGLQASMDHYNNVATVAAKVFASEDQWGVWVCGEVCSDHADRAYDLLLSPMSGHWEPDSDNENHLEMLAAHIVVTPGYNVRGRRIVASFDDDRNATSLVVPSPFRPPSEATQARKPLTMQDFRRVAELRKNMGLE